MLVLCTFLRFAYLFEIMFVFNQCTVILLGTCLTCCFRVTVIVLFPALLALLMD